MKSKNTTFFFFNENYGNKGLIENTIKLPQNEVLLTERRKKQARIQDFAKGGGPFSEA